MSASLGTCFLGSSKQNCTYFDGDHSSYDMYVMSELASLNCCVELCAASKIINTVVEYCYLICKAFTRRAKPGLGLGLGLVSQGSTCQGKLEKVGEFVWSGKSRENIIFEKLGNMILDHADCRYL